MTWYHQNCLDIGGLNINVEPGVWPVINHPWVAVDEFLQQLTRQWLTIWNQKVGNSSSLLIQIFIQNASWIPWIPGFIMFHHVSSCFIMFHHVSSESIVDFPINSMVIFHSYVNLPGRVVPSVLPTTRSLPRWHAQVAFLQGAGPTWPGPSSNGVSGGDDPGWDDQKSREKDPEIWDIMDIIWDYNGI